MHNNRKNPRTIRIILINVYYVLQSEAATQKRYDEIQYDNNNNLSEEELLTSAQCSRFHFLIVCCLKMAQ
jgi:hypothetical protein